MKISAIDVRLYRVPPSCVWQDAELTVNILEYVIVRLATDDGIEGYGLSYTTGAGGTAICAMIRDECVPPIVGLEITQTERIWNLLWRKLRRSGPGGINTLAIAAVDIAVWDAIAKARALPLYRVLGGASCSIKAYASGIDLGMSCSELRAHLENYVRQGYTAVKIKIGRSSLREDLERIAVAREVIGRDGLLMLDANQCFSLDEAKRRVAAFQEYEPCWIEEPLVAEDVEGHAHLRRATSIPIAVGESLYSKYQFLNYLRHGAADILQTDVARVGGVTEWMKIAHLAEAWSLRLAPHYLSELSVHLLCSIPNGLILEDVTGGSLAELGISLSKLNCRDGTAYPTEDVPGHGIQFDWDALKRLEVKT